MFSLPHPLPIEYFLGNIRGMLEKYKFTDPEGMYFTTTTTVGWVDVTVLKRGELTQCAERILIPVFP